MEDGHREYSYIKFVNFDVATDPNTPTGGSAEGDLGTGYGMSRAELRRTRLRDYNPYGPDLINHLKVRDGYRLMCFEYQDFMDDDIAFYNTYGASEVGRHAMGLGSS